MRTPEFRTVVDPLLDARRAEDPWLILPRDSIADAEARTLTFGDVAHAAHRLAAVLQKRGCRPAQPILLAAENGPGFVIGFFAALISGAVPVPVAVPRALRGQYASFLSAVAMAAGTEAALVDPALQAVVLKYAPWLKIVSTTEVDDGATSGQSSYAPDADALALVQYTSGSTRKPRGVELTHANLLANCRGIGIALDVRPDDVGVSWLPLYHDMGLIGCLLFTLYWGLPLVLLRPQTFLTKPESWLWAISRFGGTLSPAPNFAYATCAGRCRQDRLSGLDLSRWRAAITGAEPVSGGMMERFSARFAASGFSARAVLPVYGLAENALAACFSHPGAGVVLDHVDRYELESSGRARLSQAGAPSSRTLVSVGTPLPGQQVRIVASGREVGDRQIGEIQICGPCVMKGYRNDTAASVDAMDGAWLRTGDIGYVAEGNLFIAGRAKETIKRAGKTYSSVDVQEVVARVDQIRPGRVAALGVLRDEGSEEFVLIAEVVQAHGRVAELRREIRSQVRRSFDVTPDRIELVRPGSLPVTTSGKLRMGECRKLYLEGGLSDRLWREP